jgi:hypothetical protein
MPASIFCKCNYPFADARRGISCCRLVLGLVFYEVCQELSYAVAQTVPHRSRSVVIVANTDMTHLCRTVRYVNLPLPSLPPAYPEALGRPNAEWIM